MKTIKCVCGEEIMLIPDLKKMDYAITKHLNTKHQLPHSKGNYYLKILRERNSIRKTLVEATIQTIAEERIY